ncbi:hypothetical protein D046_3568, partial [Vibrio parahaemolyticus V-223/04]
PTIARQ